MGKGNAYLVPLLWKFNEMVYKMLSMESSRVTFYSLCPLTIWIHKDKENHLDVVPEYITIIN